MVLSPLFAGVNRQAELESRLSLSRGWSTGFYSELALLMLTSAMLPGRGRLL